MTPELPTGDVQGFGHVRIVMGMITGLAVTRLLGGLARFVQHPGRTPIYPAHLIWVIFMLVFVTHYWWFQFGLARIERWDYPQYVFVLTYCALIFFLSTLLFPDQMNEYSGYAEYFTSRAGWFYGLLGVLFLIDIADSAMKGMAHFRSLGPLYPILQTALISLALAGMVVTRRGFHIGFGLFAIGVEIWRIFSRYLWLD